MPAPAAAAAVTGRRWQTTMAIGIQGDKLMRPFTCHWPVPSQIDRTSD